MTKKKKRLLVVVVLAVVLVALLARPVVNLVIEWLDPGQAPLNDLFKLKKNEVALVINDEQSKEKGYEAEGEIYVPASVASTYMDQRIYVDTVENSLSRQEKFPIRLARRHRTQRNQYCRKKMMYFMCPFPLSKNTQAALIKLIKIQNAL